MKGRDKRLVNVIIPATENTEQMSFSIELSKLETVLKEAIENNNEVLVFKIGKETVELSIAQVKEIVKMAKLQIKAQVIIPKALQPYINSLSESMLNSFDEKLSAREEEIEKVWTCLYSKQKSNAILVGDHGVGKTAIAMEIARQISLRKCPKPFLRYNILQINTLELMELADKSNFRYRYVLETLKDFLQLNKDKIIFYIDNLLHVKCDYELFKTFMSCVKSYNIKIIASIYSEDFENYFLVDNDLIKYLNPILVEEPEIEEIYPMLKTRIDKLQEAYGVKISEKMIRFSIFTGLHLSSSNSSNPESTLDVINFALADVKRKGQKEVNKLNILSYYYINFKLAKKTSKNEKIITACHEVGHYLVPELSKNIKSKKNSFVSILPIGGALGLTASHFELGEQLTFSKNYYIDEIACCLAGRVGEALYTNEFSSGAQADLMSANAMAENLLMSYGLSDIEGEKNKSYTYGNYIKDFLLTDEIRMKIHNETSKILDEAYKRAENIINDNKDVFKEIVERLLEDGILSGDELEEICQKYRKN